MPLEREVKVVADAFLTLQEARHAADYDLAQQFAKIDALDLVDTAQTAFAAWANVRTTPNAAVFLTALLLNRQWSRA